MLSVDEELLPHVTSRVERFLVNPDGDADGMILLNGVEVYFAPYLSNAVLTAVQIGDRITVYGVLPMAEPMIVAAIIEATNGARIEDCGLPARTLSDIEAERRNNNASAARFRLRHSCVALCTDQPAKRAAFCLTTARRWPFRFIQPKISLSF